MDLMYINVIPSTAKNTIKIDAPDAANRES